MRRRVALGLMLGSIASVASPLAYGQTERPRRIGVMMQIAQSDPEAQARLAAFLEELHAFGWEVGKNLSVEYRAAAEPGEISERVSDLLSTRPRSCLR
jgi:hypothetical protein